MFSLAEGLTQKTGMLFNSLIFPFFFVVVYALYRMLGHRAQNRLLLVASYVFYGWWDWRFLGLILLSTLVDYVSGLRIAAADSPGPKRGWLTLSMCCNLGLLGVFKYCDFFIENAITLGTSLGLEMHLSTLGIVLPVGISFYTFQTMSYTIDIYRGNLKPTRNFANFALFVAFFPQLVAGPIERASHLLPQVERPRTISHEMLCHGAWLVLWGYFLKVFVADNLATWVNPVYAEPERYGGLSIILATYAFAFQILGDFAGYSNIAIGIAALMGFDLMTNFRFPYFVTNPSAFWRHWHISLSSWLRDYLYIPLGGNRGSRLATKRNLILTMLLGGLWHGASWPFVIWGAYHGCLLIVHRLTGHWWQRLTPGSPVAHRLWRFGLALIMFQLTCLGWMIFRAPSFDHLLGMLAQIGTHFLSDHPAVVVYYLKGLLFYLWLPLLIMALQARKDDLMVVFKWPAWVRWGLFILIYMMLMSWGEFGGEEFIYFQF